MPNELKSNLPESVEIMPDYSDNGRWKIEKVYMLGHFFIFFSNQTGMNPPERSSSQLRNFSIPADLSWATLFLREAIDILLEVYLRWFFLVFSRIFQPFLSLSVYNFLHKKSRLNPEFLLISLPFSIHHASPFSVCVCVTPSDVII